MTTWDELKIVVARMASEDPKPLTSWPDPRHDEGRQPPFHLRLAAWATDAAQELRQRFGNDVELMAGALRYPQRSLPDRTGRSSRAPVPELDPCEIGAALDGPLSVRSGHAARHGLLVTNLLSRELEIGTSGQLIADVVDPGSGEVVGGYSGPVFAMLQTFTVAPGVTERIPLLVATDSFVPDLGYAIPPGQWGLQAILDPAAGHAVRTAALPLTVTD